MQQRAWWLAAWALGAVFSGAQGLEAQQEPATDFFDTVDVNVVNVEVYVTDKKGNPVAGLAQDDFEVLVDGEPVEISNFYAARGKGALEAPATQQSTSTSAQPTIPISTPPPTPAPPDQQLNLVIFIDNVNITPRTRNRVLEALRGALFFNLNPDDQVMLVSYDGSINIRHGLTNDADDLMQAIEEVAQGSPRGIHASLDRASILRELQQVDTQQDAVSNTAGAPADTTIDWTGILRSIQTYAAERFQSNKVTIEHIQSFVDVLSGTTGRKALIYVSDGMELRPGEALFQAWDQKQREAGGGDTNFINIESESREYDTSAMFEELGRSANSSQVTFYTILASGGQNSSTTSAERGAFVNLNQPSSLGQVWNERFEAIETSNYRGSLQILADSTGGLSTLNTAAFGSALKRLKRDLDTYYSLGFEASEDSENHRIKVRTRDRKLKIRHRESYRNKTPDERMSDLTLSALLLESEENPLQVVVGFGEERKDEEGRYLVPIMVKFPLSSLLLLPQEKFHEGRVSIYVGARDQNGGLSPVQKMPAPIRIPNDKLLTALGQVAGFRLTLLLSPGEHAVAVGVRDELANVESTTSVSHTPGISDAGM